MFGFTEHLGIDFPGEASGMMLPPEKWSGTTIANVPIGQGISVTPLQMAVAYLRRGQRRRDGEAAPDPRRTGPGIAPGLERDGGSANEEHAEEAAARGKSAAAQVTGFTVAGKTGTAQKINDDGIGYSQEKYWASFVGMVPAEDPELVILVMVDEPQQEYYGSEVAAPAFSQIADFALKNLGIAPTCRQVGGTSAEGRCEAMIESPLVRLKDLFSEVEGCRIVGDPSIPISALSYRCSQVGPGHLFFCVPGFVRDGHDFAPEAIGRGGSALCVERVLAVAVRKWWSRPCGGRWEGLPRRSSADRAP